MDTGPGVAPQPGTEETRAPEKQGCAHLGVGLLLVSGLLLSPAPVGLAAALQIGGTEAWGASMALWIFGPVIAVLGVALLIAGLSRSHLHRWMRVAATTVGALDLIALAWALSAAAAL